MMDRSCATSTAYASEPTTPGVVDLHDAGEHRRNQLSRRHTRQTSDSVACHFAISWPHKRHTQVIPRRTPGPWQIGHEWKYVTRAPTSALASSFVSGSRWAWAYLGSRRGTDPTSPPLLRRNLMETDHSFCRRSSWVEIPPCDDDAPSCGIVQDAHGRGSLSYL
jgi:hypothetical protein